MAVANSNFEIGDVVQITEASWEHSSEILHKFNFKKGAAYEVTGVYPSGLISLKGATATYYPDYFELAKTDVVETPKAEYTGGSSNYYKVFVQSPTTLDAPYEAECNDIIEALKMTFAEGNAFKAIWRKAKARQGVQKKGYDNGLYDSEKVVFFGERMVVEAKQ